LNNEYSEKLDKKFESIKQEIIDLKIDPENFKEHALPLARIKKIMKLDDEVKMISGESPILFSKACELFIIELAYKSWVHTLENNRRTLQRVDIANAISRNDFYDFLLDIVEESCKNKLLYFSHSYIPNKNYELLNMMNNNNNNNNQVSIPLIPQNNIIGILNNNLKNNDFNNNNNNNNSNFYNNDDNFIKKENDENIEQE
jgi:nuclear transcription factor Y gamma